MIFKCLEITDFPSGGINVALIQPYLGKPCVMLGAEDRHLVYMEWPGYQLYTEVKDWLKANLCGTLFHVGNWDALAIIFREESHQFAFKMRWERPK